MSVVERVTKTHKLLTGMTCFMMHAQTCCFLKFTIAFCADWKLVLVVFDRLWKFSFVMGVTKMLLEFIFVGIFKFAALASNDALWI